MKEFLLMLILSLPPYSYGQIVPDKYLYKKGDYRIDFKFPYIYYLIFNTDKKFTENQFGFLGLGIGFEYSYKDKRYISASNSFITTFELPFPMPLDLPEGYYTILGSYYGSVLHNCQNKKITWGYGLNYSVNL